MHATREEMRARDAAAFGLHTAMNEDTAPRRIERSVAPFAAGSGVAFGLYLAIGRGVRLLLSAAIVVGLLLVTELLLRILDVVVDRWWLR